MIISDFDAILGNSAATSGLRADLAAYADARPAERIVVAPRTSRVKVLRVIAQLLHAEPSLAVDRVSLRAASGCADFVGSLVATDAAGIEHAFDFEWNCEWKAQQLGYVDGFGYPDQIRAAREFGWQCFARWTRVGTPAVQNV